jgi:putative transposase
MKEGAKESSFIGAGLNIERVICTVKEEEIWANFYDTFCEGRGAIESYLNYYNEERIHSSPG